MFGFINNWTGMTSNQANPGTRLIFNFSQLPYYGLMLFSLIASCTSAPTPGDHEDGSDSADGKIIVDHWNTTCRGTCYYNLKNVVEYNPTKNDSDIYFLAVKKSAQFAKYEANILMRSYVPIISHKPVADLHWEQRNEFHDWFLKKSDVPKELHSTVSLDHLKGLDKMKFPIKLINLLKKVNIAMQQVVLDQRTDGSSFVEEFERNSDHLKLLMCEVQDMIPTSKKNEIEKVTEEIMATEFRHVNQTDKGIRDFRFLRDYLNLLEYIIQTMDYFLFREVYPPFVET